MQTVDGLAGEKPSAPYDLSLAFNMLAETPQVVTVAANGSSYTGGAHGNPLVARFAWLPQRNELLQAPRLVDGAGAWRAISDVVREPLHASLSQLIDADEIETAQRAALQQSRTQMVDEGSRTVPGNYSQSKPDRDKAGP